MTVFIYEGGIYKMKEETIKYLLDEEAHAFKGWDFSYLKGRWLRILIPKQKDTIR